MTTDAAAFRVALRDRTMLTLTLLGALFLAVTVALIVWKVPAIGASKPFLALHYNIFFGVDRIGPWKQIFLMPAFGTAVFIVNCLLAFRLYTQERLASLTLAAAAAAVNGLLFLATLFVVLANI